MPVICPTVLAADQAEFATQIQTVAPFSARLQIDLTDGVFAKTKTVKPEHIWWPAGVKADIHLMYQNPVEVAEKLLEHKPHMIIAHAEADGDFEELAARCKTAGVKIGIALLADTAPRLILPALDYIDHVLIFSGELGSFGGHADLSLLATGKYLKHHKSSLEIGWDGGVDKHNVADLVFGGVDVLNVGAAIQESDNPPAAFKFLQRIADETGTT